MPGVLTLIRTLEERGFTFKVAGDKVRVFAPRPEAVEEARPLLDALKERKAEVRAAFIPAPALAPCPACGASADELDAVRRKRALDAALAACEEHRVGCSECNPGRMRFCAEGEALRGRYFDAWLAYHGLPVAPWDVSRP